MYSAQPFFDNVFYNSLMYSIHQVAFNISATIKRHILLINVAVRTVKEVVVSEMLMLILLLKLQKDLGVSNQEIPVISCKK